jgi:hypothetical protein
MKSISFRQGNEQIWEVSKMVSQQSDVAMKKEAQVLLDIDYITDFISKAPKARIAPDYTKGQMIKSITTSIYPQLYAYLVQNFDKEEAIQRLKILGRDAVKIYYSINGKQLQQKGELMTIFKEIGRDSGERYRISDVIKKKVGKKKVIESMVIKKYRCLFCTEAMEMEDLDIPYCLPSLAFWEQWYNIRSIYLGGWHPRLIHLDITKTAEHDKDFCEYHVKTVEF